MDVGFVSGGGKRVKGIGILYLDNNAFEYLREGNQVAHLTYYGSLTLGGTLLRFVDNATTDIITLWSYPQRNLEHPEVSYFRIH